MFELLILFCLLLVRYFRFGVQCVYSTSYYVVRYMYRTSASSEEPLPLSPHKKTDFVQMLRTPSECDASYELTSSCPPLPCVHYQSIEPMYKEAPEHHERIAFGREEFYGFDLLGDCIMVCD